MVKAAPTDTQTHRVRDFDHIILMLYTSRRMRVYKHQSGFTIVELLVVIVVIGILAAVTIVAYNGVQERARIASVSGALNQANKKLNIYQVDNAVYPPTGSLQLAGLTNGPDITYQYKTTATGYCLTATSGTTSYNTTELATKTAGACAGHGSGGVAAITNTVTNPSFEAVLTGFGSGNYGGATFSTTRQTTGGQIGPGFARATVTTAATAVGGGIIINIPSYAENVSVNVQVQVRSSRAIRIDGRIWAYASPSPGANYLGSANDRTLSSGVVLVANQWTKLTSVMVPPATSQTGRAIIQGASGTGQALWQLGDTFDVDAVFVAAGSANYGYADGNTAGWDWNGTADQSTSSGPPQ